MRVIKRVAKQEVEIEVYQGITSGGDGSVAYDSPQTIEGRFVEMTEVARSADGEEVRTTLSGWVDGIESPLPAENDRITFPVSGRTYKVIEADTRRELDAGAAVDHVKVKCIEEGA